ncbi:HMG-box [Gigaspora margarita]|uniref:HMG-box n=1 Tax=Gigaspora margarita TaxID=4874 RepID=A0A8H4B0K4_GIGMA|nr:HMG-box [Gigaspora margarita]
MSSKSRQKQPAFKGISASDEMKYKRKYRELKKKIREMEEENEKLTLKLTKAKKNIQRLRIERNFLFDRLEQSQPTNESESEPSSSPQRVIDSEEELSSQEELLEDQRTGKRRRQNRDPNAPKRPRNAFLMYCQMQREQAKEENQNKGFQDVTRILSQRWKELPQEEKGQYYDMYKQERQRYEKEMSTYVGASFLQSDGTQNLDIGSSVDRLSMTGLGSSPSSSVLAANVSEVSNNLHHNREQFVDESERGINSDYADDDLESVSEEMVDELAADRDTNGWLGPAHGSC